MPIISSKKDLDQLVTLIFGASRRLRQHFQVPAGLSMLQLGTLRLVMESNKPAMKDIARTLCITQPSATSLVNSLVRSGHLRRTNDPDDRRSIRLAITIKGQQAIKHALNKMQQQMKKSLAVLNHQERLHLYHILEKLMQ